MTVAFVPPYLLARIASVQEPVYAHAATAARATLAVDLVTRPSRAQLRLSIDASGSLVAETAAAPDREISDAESREQLPGVLARREDDPPSADATVNQAFDGLGATFDLYLTAFGRNSLDGAGSPMRATVHYGRDYDNAFWNGERMVFGDGDGEIFVGFAHSLTVIAHELSHGVIDASGGLIYHGQSGALNESIADVFAALTDQHRRGHTAEQASWLIGEDIFGPTVQGTALRSLVAPGTAYDDDVLGRDPQPAHMRDYVVTQNDNGGVHINSGIPNRAFAATALALSGYAWERAGAIWYRTLTSGVLTPTIDFAQFAHATLATARAEYGEGSEEVAAVRAGWLDTGVIDDA
ncbi:M4 family metallopeptidase [Microbacterium sp. C7(2022)]|uniref:M4 family metallopeptidase n=1 Tax=Microbacterium sp. C7(2022) TaxID=2992759 RepID=UPI00237C10EC|nr:M4 family metallopeptidase [Microbacterium sp. C7(2022)]MDE0547258.1 M4 family metallopeptidase [Microbacterium sp. C7(2022)]